MTKNPQATLTMKANHSEERTLFVYPPIYKIGPVGKRIRDFLMSGIIQGTPVLLHIQALRFGALNAFMKGVSFLGEEEFYALLLTSSLVDFLQPARSYAGFCHVHMFLLHRLHKEFIVFTAASCPAGCPTLPLPRLGISQPSFCSERSSPLVCLVVCVSSL